MLAIVVDYHACYRLINGSGSRILNRAVQLAGSRELIVHVIVIAAVMIHAEELKCVCVGAIISPLYLPLP